VISHLTGPNIIEAVGEAQQECVPKITERERESERQRVRETERQREREGAREGVVLGG
jgi:hypothetical protein